MTERLLWIAEQARRSAFTLPSPRFHQMVVEGLIALYLSDPKVRDRRVADTARAMMQGGPLVRLFFFANSRWIRRTQTHKTGVEVV